MIIHGKGSTRERGHRILPNTYESPQCLNCLAGCDETILHRYTQCVWVRDTWGLVRELLESLDALILFESDHSLINLYFDTVIVREEPFIWILGEYLTYIEREVILNNRRVNRVEFIGYLKAKRIENSFLPIPEIGLIPGLDTTGIG